jgi:site-specific DNA recombinase
VTPLPCAIYARKSSEEGLEQGFNSLDAQREACEAYIVSQKSQGWKLAGAFEDGGFSGGNVERPGLQRLLAEIEAKRVRIVVVYKVDRLTRSLADFAKLVELFDAHGVSFVSVTQAFNTTTSMGRLTLNVLLSFAQFEREVTGERIRDKIAASKKKGMWMGGFAPIGYQPEGRTLIIDGPQAERVREIFRLYIEFGSVGELKRELDRRAWVSPPRLKRRIGGGRPFSRGHLYRLLANEIYIGKITHRGVSYTGQHPALIDAETWQAAQKLLNGNSNGYGARSTAVEPSLLTGLVYDDRGIRLTPTHSKKGARRYRYYIHPNGTPARELEASVLGGLTAFLRDEPRLMENMSEVGADVVKRRLESAKSLADSISSGADRIAGLNRLVERINLSAEAITIRVRCTAAWSAVIPGTDTQIMTIVLPAQLKRVGPAVRLVVKAPWAEKARAPDARLVALLAKAQRWFELLKSGAKPGVAAIAQEQGIESSEVTRVVYLAFLAPDLVERIVRGEHPEGLNIKRLLAMAPLPSDWHEQRRRLGFTS